MRSSDPRPAAAFSIAPFAIAARAAMAAVAAVLVGVPGVALGASPSPTPGIGDPRSSGQGPGLVGDPVMAVLVVSAIAVVTVGITLAYVRMSARRETGPRP
jgi:hypothetical protein